VVSLTLSPTSVRWVSRGGATGRPVPNSAERGSGWPVKVWRGRGSPCLTAVRIQAQSPVQSAEFFQSLSICGEVCLVPDRSHNGSQPNAGILVFGKATSSEARTEEPFFFFPSRSYRVS